MNIKPASLEEQALDIVLGDGLTGQQLDALQGSDELQECVQDALDLRTVMQREARPVDVGERLRQFKIQNFFPSRKAGTETYGSKLKIKTDPSGHEEVGKPLTPATQHPTSKLGVASPLSEGEGLGVRQGRRTHIINLKPQISILKALLVAAVFIGAIFLLVPRLIPNGGQPSPPPCEGAGGRLFTAATTQSGISLTAQNGDRVTLSPSSKQSSTVTLDDFRRIFADEENIKDLTLTVPIGKSADIVLPDSSVASLSPGSQLTFPARFGDRRVVKLEGSGYFKVRHDAAHPFTVLTGQAETTVLGTEFAVDSKRGSVTLVSGRVSVRQQGAGRGTVLMPSQQARMGKDGTLSVAEVDTKPFTMWRDGYLYFDNVELQDIMLAIGENFNKTIDFRSTRALHYRMRFVAERNAGVSEAIRMMNRMDKVRVSLHGNTIVVEDL